MQPLYQVMNDQVQYMLASQSKHSLVNYIAVAAFTFGMVTGV